MTQTHSDTDAHGRVQTISYKTHTARVFDEWKRIAFTTIALQIDYYYDSPLASSLRSRTPRTHSINNVFVILRRRHRRRLRA